MRAELFEISVGELTYRAEEPHLRDGLKVTLTVLGTGRSPDPSDRLNLDRAPARRKFAEEAGISEADLLTVRTTLLAQLSPPIAAGSASQGPIAADDPTALTILDAPDLLDHMAATVRDLGYAGKDWPVRLVYLVLTSRLLPRPLNLVFSGPSSAGKSFTYGVVTHLFPPDAIYLLSGMSERTLAYTDADLSHRMLIIGEASALHRDGLGASLLRNLAWEGRLIYETVEKVDGQMRSRLIEKPGPTGFITTTTGRVEKELETRVLTVPIDDTPQATRMIINAIAKQANGHAPEPPDLAPWLAAQAWLRVYGDRKVKIPFSEALGHLVSARTVRMRRDFTQILTLIMAHALLHQRQRERDDRGRVLADARDYDAIYDLAAPVFGAIAADGVTPAIRETVDAVKLASGPSKEPVPLGKVAELLGLDKGTASRRVKICTESGWLVNDEDRRGRQAKLFVGESLPEERPALPSPEELFSFDRVQRCNSGGATGDPSAQGNEDTVAEEDATATQQPQRPAPTDAAVAWALHEVGNGRSPDISAENNVPDEGCCTVASETEGALPEVWGEAECARCGGVGWWVQGQPWHCDTCKRILAGQPLNSWQHDPLVWQPVRSC